MMMAPVMIMAMVVIMVLGDKEIGFDIEDAVEIEGPAPKHFGNVDVAFLARCSAGKG